MTRTPLCRFWLSLTVAAFSISLLGCGGEAEDAPERYQISGTVTYDGQPIPKGIIKFTPDAGKGNTGPQGKARIVDGEYSTAEEGGAGVVGGPYKITVQGYDGNADPDKELPLGEPLFKEHRIDKELPSIRDDLEEPVNVDIIVPKQPGSKGRRQRGRAKPV